MLLAMTLRQTTSLSRLPAAVALAALCALAACGGGVDNAGRGDSGDGGGGVAPPTPPVAPDPGTPGTRATCNLPSFETTVLARVNEYRRAGATCGDRGSFPAAGDLAWSAALAAAALVHSDDMAAGNFFSHTGSDGRNAGQRITAAGYDWSTWAENIAAGQPTVVSVVDAWMASPGHCVNLMQPRLRDIGVACVSGGAGNTYRSYWTMTLAAAR
jgi:uncharacterized protein YkwD